ncbi:MAG: hypothetical protein ACXACK_14810, partial [Candidatus Hodarchaeales archaeon]|jgi:hypothetical protein
MRNLNSEKEEINLKIPSTLDFPPSIANIKLTPTEQRVYLLLSLEFQNIIDNAPSFQIGAYKWNQILPQLLQKFALDIDGWERISNLGDTNETLQAQLDKLTSKMEELR